MGIPSGQLKRTCAADAGRGAGHQSFCRIRVEVGALQRHLWLLLIDVIALKWLAEFCHLLFGKRQIRGG